MNLLYDALPETVEVDGKQYKINTDFRVGLRIMAAFEDDTLTNYEKQLVMLANLYPIAPKNVNKAAEQANWFLNSGDVTDKPGGPRVMSFVKDAQLIFAAFQQTHGINLTAAKLHWWEFAALLMDLGSDTAFCNLVSLRRRIKTGKATKEERRAALELGEAFDIQEMDDRTIEQREAERRYNEAIAEGMRLRQQGK